MPIGYLILLGESYIVKKRESKRDTNSLLGGQPSSHLIYFYELAQRGSRSHREAGVSQVWAFLQEVAPGLQIAVGLRDLLLSPVCTSIHFSDKWPSWNHGVEIKGRGSFIFFFTPVILKPFALG